MTDKRKECHCTCLFRNIIHLDNPSPKTIRQRTEEVMREELTDEAFEEDCPICQEMKKHPYDIVYYDENNLELQGCN